MKLGKQLYLTLERVEQSHRIAISSDIRDVFSRWKASTRVSPIYSIERGTPIIGDGFRFRGALEASAEYEPAPIREVVVTRTLVIGSTSSLDQNASAA